MLSLAAFSESLEETATTPTRRMAKPRKAATTESGLIGWLADSFTSRSMMMKRKSTTTAPA